MSEESERASHHLCVECGEKKPAGKFHVGDCTCTDCHEAESNDDGRLVRGSDVYIIDDESGHEILRAEVVEWFDDEAIVVSGVDVNSDSDRADEVFCQ